MPGRVLSSDPNAGTAVPPSAGRRARRVLSSDPDAGTPIQRASVPALATKQSELRQGQPDDLWTRSWDAVRQGLFNLASPMEQVRQLDRSAGLDREAREEARQAGVGLQPSAEDMVETGMAGAAMLGMGPGASAVARRAATKAPGVVGSVAQWAAEHPRTVATVKNAAAGAIPGAMHGDERTALGGAVAGAVLGPRAAAVERAAAPAVAPAVAKAATAAPTVVSNVGKAVAGAHSRLMAFAKEAAKSNPKIGEKIWVQLDADGIPVKILTPDQAGAAARKGLKTTWVKNLWK